MESLVRTSAAGSLAVPLATVKEFLRVTWDEEDTTLEIILRSAIQSIEDYAATSLISQGFRKYRSEFPTMYGKDRSMFLGMRPLVSVASVTYYDIDGTQQTLSTDVYSVTEAGSNPWVNLKPGQVWPATEIRENAVAINFTAGYGSAGVVPRDLVSAVLLACADKYRNRGDVNVVRFIDIPHAALAICERYREGVYL